MATPACEASKGEIAPTVIVCGDPLRAKLIAERYLKKPRCYNQARGMLGFTGDFEGTTISVQGHGMGMPSIGLYTYELYHYYDVERIIRAGSAGAIQEGIYLMDIVLAIGACTDSNYAAQYHLPGTFAPIADFSLLTSADRIAREQGIEVKAGNILSSDLFYSDAGSDLEWDKMGVLCVEMEIAALYMNAARAGKKALGILTISDELRTKKALNTAQRQESFERMIELALALAVCKSNS